MPSGPSRPGLPRRSVSCRPTHGPSSEGPEIGGDDHVPGALDEIPKPVVVALLRARRGRHGMIIGRSLTPLNSSRMIGGVRRRDDHSRGKVPNVRGVVMSGGSPRDMKIWYSATAGR